LWRRGGVADILLGRGWLTLAGAAGEERQRRAVLATYFAPGGKRPSIQFFFQPTPVALLRGENGSLRARGI